jgi:hypothetical protein
MESKAIMLSEIIHSHQIKYHMMLLICEMVVTRGWGEWEDVEERLINGFYAVVRSKPFWCTIV